MNTVMILTPKEHVAFQHLDEAASALVEVPRVLYSGLFAQATPGTFAASNRTALLRGLRLQLGSSLQNAANSAGILIFPSFFRKERRDQHLPQCRRYLTQTVILRLPPNRRSVPKFGMPPPSALRAGSHSPCTRRPQHRGIPSRSDFVSVSASLLPCHDQRMLQVLFPHLLPALHSCMSRCSRFCYGCCHSRPWPGATWAPMTVKIRLQRFARVIAMIWNGRYQGASSLAVCACASRCGGIICLWFR